MTIWWVMLAGGLVTFLIRYSFIAAEGSYQPAEWFRRLLPLVPISALTALVVPDLLVVDGAVMLSGRNFQLLAGLVAIAAAAIWRNTLLTIGVGFAALFLLRAFA
jgi:branched-subunit amino acid transport protein